MSQDNRTLTWHGLIGRNLLRRPGRALFTLLGVALAVASYVALTGLASGHDRGRGRKHRRARRRSGGDPQGHGRAVFRLAARIARGGRSNPAGRERRFRRASHGARVQRRAGDRYRVARRRVSLPGDAPARGTARRGRAKRRWCSAKRSRRPPMSAWAARSSSTSRRSASSAFRPTTMAICATWRSCRSRTCRSSSRARARSPCFRSAWTGRRTRRRARPPAPRSRRFARTSMSRPRSRRCAPASWCR